MFFYLQPVYLESFGSSKLVIGTLLGASGFFMAVVHTPAGYLSDRIGPRPVMWMSWMLGIIACTLMATASSLEAFVIGMFLYSATAFGMAPMNSYIARMRGGWSLVRTLTFCSAMYNVGAILGPILGGWVAESLGLQSTYKVAAFIFILSTLLIFTIKKLAAEPKHDHESHSSIFRNQRFLIFLGVVFATLFALYLPQALTPNYLQSEHGLSYSQIGQVGTIGNLGNVVIMILLGNLASGRGVLIGQALVILFNLLLWQGTGVAWFALGYFFAGGHRLARAMLMAFARPFLHDAHVGFAFGLVETVNGLTMLAAPALAGLLYEQSPVFPYQIGLMLIAVTLVVNLLLLPRLQQGHHEKIDLAKAENA
jgi:MFS family permease